MAGNGITKTTVSHAKAGAEAKPTTKPTTKTKTKASSGTGPKPAVKTKTKAGAKSDKAQRTGKSKRDEPDPRSSPSGPVRTPPVLLARGHLRRRGWTESGILKFLGEPDAHAPNPVVWSAAHMRLYDQDRVADIEATEVWQRWRAESEQRREVNRRRAEERGRAHAEHLGRLGLYAEVASHVANR